MGLPLFVMPVEPDTASKSAEKVPGTTRSAIRRHRAFRGPHARLTSENRRRRMLGLIESSGGATEHETSWENRQRSPPIDNDGTSVLSIQARAHQLFDGESSRLRDVLSFERQHRPNAEVDGPLMPPVPESRDYSSTEERQRELQRVYQVRQDLRRMARRQPAPTPPYTDTDLALINRIGLEYSPRTSSLTPRRSPTISNDDLVESRRDRDNIADSRGTPYTADQPGRSALDRLHENQSDRLSGLTRTHHHRVLARSRIHDPETRRLIVRQARRMDGLGDRDRSLSPEGGGAWDTLLTSIPPDPQPPSASSSFTSSSAAVAASQPTSGSTSMTSLARAESPTIGDCDLASDSGSNSDDEDMYELLQIGRSRGDRFLRSYADVVTARDNREDREDYRERQSTAAHTRDVRRIILRLASTDEIPDEWWAGSSTQSSPPTRF